MRNTHWFALLIAVVIASVAVPAMGDGDPTKGSKGKLFGTAKEDTDPQNDANPVISFDSQDPTSYAGIERKLQKDVKVASLDNHLETKYLLVDRTCAAGSPRFQLAVDTDGDGKSDGNAFGYLNEDEFGAPCPQGEWVYTDMTNDGPKWDLTQFGAGHQNTWDEVEAFFGASPDHQVLSVMLVDDSSWNAAGQGCAYFDLISLSDKTIDSHEDVSGGGEGKKTNDC